MPAARKGAIWQHQAGKRSGGGIAKGLSYLKLVRLVTGGEPRRHALEHKILLHKAASEVRYITIFNNGSTTGPNGVSELSLELGATQGHSAYH
jgi:hypothetical protein